MSPNGCNPCLRSKHKTAGGYICLSSEGGHARLRASVPPGRFWELDTTCLLSRYG